MEPGATILRTDVARHVWETRYRHHDGPDDGDRTIEVAWRRVARAVSAVETRDHEAWERRFIQVLKGFSFLPGGRIQAGAGTGRNVTLFNCFVMGPIEDSMEGIFRALPQQEDSARSTRRVGLGITGLADTLIMLGVHYGSEPARSVAARLMQLICHAAYRASVQVARDKGAFPSLDREKHLQAPFVANLPGDIRAGIAAHGIRNSHLLAIAPTGTISLLAGNVSSGLEPVFAGEFERTVLNEDGTTSAFRLVDYGLDLWRRRGGRPDSPPPAFVCASELAPRDHLAMQAALQRHVDSSISKTINVPEDCPFAAFRGIYDAAYDLGLKGCTTFRSNPITGSVLTAAEQMSRAPHCCALEREAD